MSTKNFYPSFPEIPYKRTSIDMPTVVAFAKTLVGKYHKEVVRMSYCIFRNESGNGSRGVNNNYGGIQADNAVWEGLNLTNVVGTCLKVDGNNEMRRFICFNQNGYQTCFDFLCYKINQRGMYIGAANVKTPEDLYNIYQAKWVDNPSEDTPQAKRNFESLYQSSQIQIP